MAMISEKGGGGPGVLGGGNGSMLDPGCSVFIDGSRIKGLEFVRDDVPLECARTPRSHNK